MCGRNSSNSNEILLMYINSISNINVCNEALLLLYVMKVILIYIYIIIIVCVK